MPTALPSYNCDESSGYYLYKLIMTDTGGDGWGDVTYTITTDGATRWTGPLIDRVLSGVMAATLTPAQRRGKTFHSKRVWAATGFTGLNASESEVMALVRWATPESLRVYRVIYSESI